MKLLATALLLILAATLVQAEEVPVCSHDEEKKDDCNTCICNKGNWACTKKACPKVEQACKVGDHKFDGCNTCICVEGGGWACTEKFCLKPEAEDGESCQPGTSFQDDCNTCTCGHEGKKKLSACTLKACLH